MCAAPRDGQREVAYAAEHVRDAFASTRTKQAQRAPHQHHIHRRIDLRKLGRRKTYLQVKFAQVVVKHTLMGRIERCNRCRPLRLQKPLDLMLIGKRSQQMFVFGAQRLQYAQYQCVRPVAYRELHLRHALRYRQRVDQAT